MPRIDKPLTTVQFLDYLPDVAGHRLDSTHKRHARAVMHLTHAAADLLAWARTNPSAGQSAAVLEVEAALQEIRGAV